MNQSRLTVKGLQAQLDKRMKEVKTLRDVIDSLGTKVGQLQKIADERETLWHQYLVKSDQLSVECVKKDAELYDHLTTITRLKYELGDSRGEVKVLKEYLSTAEKCIAERIQEVEELAQDNRRLKVERDQAMTLSNLSKGINYEKK